LDYDAVEQVTRN